MLLCMYVKVDCMSLCVSVWLYQCVVIIRNDYVNNLNLLIFY